MSRATFATLGTILGPRMAEILAWEDLKRATKIAEIQHKMTGLDFRLNTAKRLKKLNTYKRKNPEPGPVWLLMMK